MIGDISLDSIEVLAGNALGMSLGERPTSEIDISRMSVEFHFGVWEKWREASMGATIDAMQQGKISGDLLESLAKREDEERLEKWQSQQGSAE